MIAQLKHVLSFAKQETAHRASLPYEDVPEFMAALRAEPDSVKKFALEFVILCGVRVADVTGGGRINATPMCWSHVDLDARTWTVPITKMGHAHVVPLSDAALAVLAQVQRYRDVRTDFCFPGATKGTAISDATLRYLIGDLGYGGIATVHGFRASLKTWCEEVMAFDRGVVEAALAHSQGKLNAAYHRGSYLAKRRVLMSSWASYLAGETAELGGNVTALRA